VSDADLLEYYGPHVAPSPDAEPVRITLDILRTCIADAPPLSSPHKDGWRTEHLATLSANQVCNEALAEFASSLVKGEGSDKIADLLSSVTLVVLLKKENETMKEMKRLQGPAYVQPQRPLGMGSTLIKVASNCALILIRGSLGPTVGPTQFSVETKGGCDLIQWALSNLPRRDQCFWRD
jgi:hypothetical protein